MCKSNIRLTQLPLMNIWFGTRALRVFLENSLNDEEKTIFFFELKLSDNRISIEKGDVGGICS